MSRIQIVSDSSCDLPEAMVQRFGISIVPLVVRFGEQVFTEDQISHEEFWRHAQSAPPHTSQPPVGAFMEKFALLVEEGNTVICLTITGQHSGTYNSACLAAQQFPGQVYVVDSKSLSLGLGLQVLNAARAALDDLSVNDILAHLAELRDRLHVAILLDSVENIRRGGRADGLMPLIDRVTRALSIKPLLGLSKEGKLGLMGAMRTYDRGLKRLCEEVKRRLPVEQLGVAHCRYEEAALKLADTLAELTNIPRPEILCVETGAALASHAGPGVVGVMTVSRT